MKRIKTAIVDVDGKVGRVDIDGGGSMHQIFGRICERCPS
jgi:hypothetical protein